MINSDTRARILQRYPALKGVEAAKLEALLTMAKVMRIPAETVMFDENQPCQGFPLLLSGSLRVIKSSSNGRELQLYRVMTGESCIMTSSCLLGNSRYHARGIVEEDVEIVLLPSATFHTLLAEQEAFRHYVFHLFTERLTDLMELVTAVAFQKLDQRLAALLISKTNPIHTTHQALADELGSAREMVSRLLKSFAEQGWVQLGRENITLTNLDSIKKFSRL